MSRCYRCGSPLNTGGICPSPWCQAGYAPVVSHRDSTAAGELRCIPFRPVYGLPLRGRIAEAMKLRAALTSFAVGTEEWWRDIALAAANEVEKHGRDHEAGR